MKTLKKSFLIAEAAFVALSLIGCQDPEVQEERPSSGIETMATNQGSTITKTITVDLSDNPLTDDAVADLKLDDDVSYFFDAQFLDSETMKLSYSGLDDLTATLKEFSNNSLTVEISATVPEKDGKLLIFAELGGDDDFEDELYSNQKGVLLVNIGNVPNVTEASMAITTVTLAEDEDLTLSCIEDETETTRTELWFNFTNGTVQATERIYSIESSSYTSSSKKAEYTFKDGVMYDSSNNVYGSLVKNGDTYYIISTSMPRTDGTALFATFAGEVSGGKASFSFYEDGIVEWKVEFSDDDSVYYIKSTEFYTNENGYGYIFIYATDDFIYDGSSILAAAYTLTKEETVIM